MAPSTSKLLRVPVRYYHEPPGIGVNGVTRSPLAGNTTTATSGTNSERAGVVRSGTGESTGMTITTDPLERVDEIRLLEDELPTTEDVWVLWLRTPGGNYNILSAGPTRMECMAVLDKLLPGSAPGESLRCLPKTLDPRESMEPRGSSV